MLHPSRPNVGQPSVMVFSTIMSTGSRLTVRSLGREYYTSIDSGHDRFVDLDAFFASGASLEDMKTIYDVGTMLADPRICNKIIDDVGLYLSTDTTVTPALTPEEDAVLFDLFCIVMEDFDSSQRPWVFMPWIARTGLALSDFDGWTDTGRARFYQFHSFCCGKDPDGSELHGLLHRAEGGECHFHENCDGACDGTQVPTLSDALGNGNVAPDGRITTSLHRGVNDLFKDTMYGHEWSDKAEEPRWPGAKAIEGRSSQAGV